MKSIHVACGQIVCETGKIEENLNQIEMLSEQAAQKGARLILFGEAALTGYVFNEANLKLAISQNSSTVERLKSLSRKCDIVIAAGAIEQDEHQRFVSHFICFPNGELIVQRKHNLTPTEKAAGIKAGPEKRIIFEIDKVKFAICICADSGIENIRNKLVDWGAEVFLGPTAGGGSRDAMFRPEDILNKTKRKTYLENMGKVCFVGQGQAEAARYKMACAAVNLSGDDGISNYHPGHSSIIDSTGRLVALQPGEYVADWLEPRLINGIINVQSPRKI
jgi:predicted amidohydrolase